MNVLRLGQHFAHEAWSCCAQVARGVLPELPVPTDGREVVLVHGWGATSSAFRFGRQLLHENGRTTVTFSWHPWQGDVAGISDCLASFLRGRAQETGQNVDVVAWSMGGIISLRAMCGLAGSDVVRSLVTLATPHHGARAAAFTTAFRLPVGAGRELCPQSPLITGLQRNRQAVAANVFTVGAEHDVVVPDKETVIDVDRHFTVRHAGHHSLLERRATWTYVERCLQD